MSTLFCNFLGWHYMTYCLYNRQVGSSASFHCVRFVRNGTSCTRIGEENPIEVAHISTTFVMTVFSLVCSTSSYFIERVTEHSCLFFYISVCTIVFSTAHFSHVCFLPLSVSSGDHVFSTSNCRDKHLLALEIIFVLFICLPHRPFLSWLVCRLYHIVFSSAGCLSVSKRRSFVTLYNYIRKLHLEVCRMFSSILVNALIDRHIHLFIVC